MQHLVMYSWAQAWLSVVFNDCDCDCDCDCDRSNIGYQRFANLTVVV